MADLEEIKQELEKEMIEWHKLPPFAQPSVIARVDLFLFSAKFDSLIQMLIQTDVVEETEYERRYKTVLLERLQTMRPQVEQEVRKAELAHVQVPQIILGPDGKPLVH